MAITVHKSNRLEQLATSLAARLKGEPLPPLTADIVVVQSRGMARWLALCLADELGVHADMECPFPNAFVSRLFEHCFAGRAELGFEKGLAAWYIARLLPELIEQPAFARVRDYLADGSAIKRLQLSGRLADLFDQYIIYRPELVLAWDGGQGEDWQALLWRHLLPLFGGVHRAALQRDCLALLAGPGARDIGLPPRVSVFGISSLPPYYIELFNALSEHSRVDFYLLNPCREYWGDIVTDREMARLTRRQTLSEADLYLTKGNSLLAATGQQGRDFFELLESLGCQESECFREPGEASLLAAIQTDILQLTEPGLETGGEPRQLARADRSIRIHSCHSPMREVEVLRDQLLRCFDENQALEPRDVLVMAPDIEIYTPLIQAVFDEDLGEPHHIPYSIADRTMRREGRFIELFLAVLDLADSRLGVNRVRAVIGHPAVAGRFGIAADDLGVIDRWLRESGIRWGLDARSRERRGLPPTMENTWRFGLDRLLLGYAMAGQGRRLFMDILPYDRMEGGETRLLGRLLDCVETLFGFVGRMEEPRRLEEWSVLLGELLNGLFDGEGIDEAELRLIRQELAALARYQATAGFVEQLDAATIRAYLAGALERENSPHGFLAGGVTFCAMLPMRAVPFKVVCLLGMNDKDYPRPDFLPSFNKIGEQGRPGDRSRRLDDRYIFLEALLSARHHLHVSYVGQSINDDGRFPPSVLVSELVEYAGRNFNLAGDPAGEQLVTHHPLQGFSPRYFAGSAALASYSARNCRAAGALLAGKREVPLLVERALPALPLEMREVQIDRLLHFLAHPVRGFCQHRLGLVVPEPEELLAEKELFALAGLERYQMKNELAGDYLDSGGGLPSLYPALRAAGRLPHGRLGEVAYQEICAEASDCGRRLAGFRQGGPLPPVDLALTVGGFSLRGRLAQLYGSGLLGYRCAVVKGKDLLRHWLCHLLLQLADGAGLPRRSVLAGSDKAYVLAPMAREESTTLLEQLLAFYWTGLGRPLPFYPESSLAFAEAIRSGRAEEAARERARHELLGDDFKPGEAEDRYYQLCFRSRPPLDAEFARLALEVYGPLLVRLEEMRP